jgi:alpha-beta hydrolase superfamily lysophospholipase
MLVNTEIHDIVDDSVSSEDVINNEENLESWLKGQQWRNFTSKIGRPWGRKIQDVQIQVVTIRGSGTKGILSVSIGAGAAIAMVDEFLYDVSQMGYSPIYVYCHRGQGESDRLTTDTDSLTHYVQRAEDLVADMVSFMAFVEEETRNNPSNPEDATKQHFHHCSSMGCGVAIAYMTEAHRAGKQPAFSALLAAAPLLKVNTGSIPFGIARGLARVLISIGRGTKCAPTTCKTFEGKYAPNAFDSNKGTHSLKRFERRREKCITYRNEPVGADGHKGICILDQSSNLVLALMDLEKDYVRKFARKGNQLTTPLRIQQARIDTSVINDDQTEFCNKVATECTVTEYASSYHDIPNEADGIRGPALIEMKTFFESLSKTRVADLDDLYIK